MSKLQNEKSAWVLMRSLLLRIVLKSIAGMKSQFMECDQTRVLDLLTSRGPVTPEDLERAKVAFTLAQKDFEIAIQYVDDDEQHQNCGLHLQQAAEKLIKVLIHLNGGNFAYRKGHIMGLPRQLRCCTIYPMTNSFEVVLLETPISIRDFDGWVSSIKTKIGSRILGNLNANTDNFDRYLECAELQELPGTFICCSFFQADINDALTRAGIFMGAGKGMSAGTLSKQTDFPLRNYKKLVAGHNLPGPVLLSFAKNTRDANEAEQAFFDRFLSSERIQTLNKNFYVIGFSIQSTKDQKGVVSHEIYHAYYFLNSTYRQCVLDFWRKVVTPEDRMTITAEIGRAYNVENEDLVIDEFQAYLVQSGADKDRMKGFVAKYRDTLLKEIANAKIQLVQI